MGEKENLASRKTPKVEFPGSVKLFLFNVVFFVYVYGMVMGFFLLCYFEDLVRPGGELQPGWVFDLVALFGICWYIYIWKNPFTEGLVSACSFYGVFGFKGSKTIRRRLGFLAFFKALKELNTHLKILEKEKSSFARKIQKWLHEAAYCFCFGVFGWRYGNVFQQFFSIRDPCHLPKISHYFGLGMVLFFIFCIRPFMSKVFFFYISQKELINERYP